VPGLEGARAAAHGLPAGGGLLGVRGLAEGLAVQVEDRVAADHQGALDLGLRGHDGGLGLGEGEGQFGGSGGGHGVLVDPADDHLGVEPGLPQQAQPGGGLGGEHETAARLIGHAVSVSARRAAFIRVASGRPARPGSPHTDDDHRDDHGQRHEDPEPPQHLLRVAQFFGRLVLGVGPQHAIQPAAGR
jgi:hypothetical protein